MKNLIFLIIGVIWILTSCFGSTKSQNVAPFVNCQPGANCNIDSNFGNQEGDDNRSSLRNSRRRTGGDYTYSCIFANGTIITFPPGPGVLPALVGAPCTDDKGNWGRAVK